MRARGYTRNFGNVNARVFVFQSRVCVCVEWGYIHVCEHGGDGVLTSMCVSVWVCGWVGVGVHACLSACA